MRVQDQKGDIYETRHVEIDLVDLQAYALVRDASGNLFVIDLQGCKEI